MIRTILLTGVFVLLATTAAMGEYYKYTDESGNLRFTDDISQVPEEQRPAVEQFESVINIPDDVMIEGYSESEATEESFGTDQPENSPPISGDIGGVDDEEGTFEVRAAELNKMQAELNETRMALENEKKELKAAAPGEGAKSNDRIAYSVKVDSLNSKIQKYDNDLKAFQEKVNAFNNRGKKIVE